MKSAGDDYFKNIYLMMCLILLSYKDIKSRLVPVIWLILIGAGIPVIYVYDYMINGNVPDYIRLIIAAVIMALLVVVSLFTSLIGEADGIIIGYVCFLMDVYAAVTAVLISFVLLAVTGGMLMAFKKIKLKRQFRIYHFCLWIYYNAYIYIVYESICNTNKNNLFYVFLI